MKKYITKDPNILGGEPVITGTRIPIARVLYLLKDGYTLESIKEDYKWVDLETLKKAVDEAIAMISNQPNVSQIL